MSTTTKNIAARKNNAQTIENNIAMMTMEPSRKEVRRLLDIQIKAIRDGIFDYPKDHVFANVSEVHKAIADGKTSYFWTQECLIKWSSVTSAVLAFKLQYVSKSTEAAIRKGIINTLTAINIANQLKK